MKMPLEPVDVLEGTLNTHQGTYGPGNFATADADCTFLGHLPDRPISQPAR